MLFICTKIENVAVALLVLLVFEATLKKKQTFPCERYCCCHALGTRKNLQTLPCEQSCCRHALEHEKNFGAKKIQIFLLKLTIKKFLRPSGDNPGFSHTDIIFILKVKARLISQKGELIVLGLHCMTRYGMAVTGRPPYGTPHFHQNDTLISILFYICTMSICKVKDINLRNTANLVVLLI